MAVTNWIDHLSAKEVAGAVYPGVETTEFWSYLRALVLPGITLTIVMAIYAVRMLRDNLVEVLDSAYVRGSLRFFVCFQQ